MDWKLSLKELLPRRAGSAHGFAARGTGGRSERADFHTLEFSPQHGQGEQGVRRVLSCERHRSRSLLALGHCSRHCVKSCMLADTPRGMEDA
jgi:hypothetical protein